MRCEGDVSRSRSTDLLAQSLASLWGPVPSMIAPKFMWTTGISFLGYQIAFGWAFETYSELAIQNVASCNGPIQDLKVGFVFLCV